MVGYCVGVLLFTSFVVPLVGPSDPDSFCVVLLQEHHLLRFRGQPRAKAAKATGIGLYTILLLPILYGLWHTKERFLGGVYIAQESCNSIATVWAMQAGRTNERTIDSCTND